MEEIKEQICQKTNTEISGEECIWKSFGIYLLNNYKRLLKFGCIGSLIVLVVMMLILCAIPREKSYMLSAYILLEAQGDNTLYPNGEIFSALDILSPLVLRKVYTDLKLEKKMSYETFASSLSIAQGNQSLNTEAKYTALLNDKKINYIKIVQLDEQFVKTKARLRNTKLTLSMSCESKCVSKEDASGILNATLETWYKIYSKLHSRSFPCVDFTEQMKNIRKNFNQASYFIPLEKSRVYSNELLAICNLLNSMLQGKNIYLPSGETFGDITRRLIFLQRYKIDLYQQYILMHAELQFPMDKIYLISNYERIENELVRLSLIGRGIEEAMNIISFRLVSGNNTAENGKDSKLVTAAPMQDIEFFNSIAGLIQNNVNSKIRHRYADRILQNKAEYAQMLVEKKYFLKLLGITTDKKQKNKHDNLMSLNQLNEQVMGIYTELLKESTKIMQFRDLVLKQYLSSRKFYNTDKKIIAGNDYAYSPWRTEAGVVFMWMLLFGIFVIYDFLSERNKQKFCSTVSILPDIKA